MYSTDMRRATRSKGHYYLGRVIKRGLGVSRSSSSSIAKAIQSPAVVSSKSFLWTFSDFQSGVVDNCIYIFSKLLKIAPKEDIDVVKLERREVVQINADNVLVASSPFIYLPRYSGVAYLHVWNHIRYGDFINRFSQIINSSRALPYVYVSIDPISDYGVFVSKIKMLKSVTRIVANVTPPNPVYGRIWKSLDEYLRNRHVSELRIQEDGSHSGGINTAIDTLMEKLNANSAYEPETPPSLTDAAILMAADGYGKARVTGYVDEKGKVEVTLHTSQEVKRFLFDKDPTPESLAAATITIFKQLAKDRGMDTDK